MSWVVVETKSLQEKIAIKSLSEQRRACSAVFCPTYEREVRHARYVEMRKFPLYPRYIFAQVDLRERGWIAILNSRGVRGILPHPARGTLCRPLPVADEVVALIGCVTEVPLRRGDRVLLREWGVEALFSEYVEDRCKVLISFLGRQVEWDVSRLQVEKIQTVSI